MFLHLPFDANYTIIPLYATIIATTSPSRHFRQLARPLPIQLLLKIRDGDKPHLLSTSISAYYTKFIGPLPREPPREIWGKYGIILSNRREHKMKQMLIAAFAASALAGCMYNKVVKDGLAFYCPFDNEAIAPNHPS